MQSITTAIEMIANASLTELAVCAVSFAFGSLIGFIGINLATKAQAEEMAVAWLWFAALMIGGILAAIVGSWATPYTGMPMEEFVRLYTQATFIGSLVAVIVEVIVMAVRRIAGILRL